MREFFANYFEELNKKVSSFDGAKMHGVIKAVKQTQARGAKILIFGNGGSATIANHFSLDLQNILGIKAICFNDASLISCLSNDFGFEQWKQKGLEAKL